MLAIGGVRGVRRRVLEPLPRQGRKAAQRLSPYVLTTASCRKNMSLLRNKPKLGVLGLISRIDGLVIGRQGMASQVAEKVWRTA